MSRLDLVVGPNGAGKSTFVEFVLADIRPGVDFVNADIIAEQQWPEDPAAHAYEAAEVAAAVRRNYIDRGVSFVTETVASHPSKVELVDATRAAGFHVHLIVIAVPEDLTVARVAARVADGGHGVPEGKIRERYARLWAHVVAMLERADTAEVFDNSGATPETIATFVAGTQIGDPRWPSWIAPELPARWP